MRNRVLNLLKKVQDAKSTTFQVVEALQIGVQGIGITQISNPTRQVIGLPEIEPIQKIVWNIGAREKFQQAIAGSEALTKSAKKQRAVILQNNPLWDEKNHPFPEKSIELFLLQISLLNDVHIDPVKTAGKLSQIEDDICDTFIQELGSVDGAAGKILHSTVAKLSSLRLIIMYAPGLDDAVHHEEEAEEEQALVPKSKQ